MNQSSYELSNRILKLKEHYLKVIPSISINRAISYTKTFKEFSNLSKNILKAKSFKKACEEAPLFIQEDELIVGHPCGKARAGSFSPDIAWEWLENELDTISKRSQDPYFISEEDKKILKNEIFPFWKNKSLAEACEKELKKENLWEFGAEACISDLTYHIMSGGGDTSPGFDIILLKKGINGIKKEAEENLLKLSKNKGKDLEKINFYKSVIDVCDGITIYSLRLSDYTKQLSEKEGDFNKKKELEKISEILKNVPMNPPNNFYEALQSIWTIQSLFLLEENQCSTSLGRVDQYLYPYLENDLKNNIITEEEAFELLCCFAIKCSEVIWYTPSATAKYFAGYMPFINMTVGGIKRTGGDGTNQLTYLIMDVVEKIKLYQPSLACRIHNQSPIKYLEKIVDIIKAGSGMPACHFDDAHIKMMLRKGFDYDDARDYCLMGCVEPQKSGKIHQWTAGGFTQWPITLELVFNQGILRSYGNKQWLDTGNIEDLDTYEKFENAIKKQLDFIIDLNCKGTTIIQEVFRKENPTPYMSIFVDGCMENGKDVTNGGASLYEGPGTIFAGLATFADSMAAIKKLVFEDKKYTLKDIKIALDNNWEGFEHIKKDCLNSPKYGNDIDYVDFIAKDIIDYTEKKMNSYNSLFARQIHGTLSQSFNTPLGEMIGATPNGRMANTFLSDAMSPSQGADKNGVTAVIKSVSKLNVESMSLGMAHNFKFSKNFLETNEGKQSIITLLRTSSFLGNGQMQFNCVDNETLKEAQKNPEKYRDLVVRVAGYSAFFVELCKEVQDEIIARNILEK